MRETEKMEGEKKNNSTLHGTLCPTSASWAWKCLHTIKEKIKPFISWIVGDGKFIDPWSRERGTRRKLQTHFDQSSFEKIVRIPLSSTNTPDRRAWDLTRDGRFTTKSAYLGLVGQRDQNLDKLWKSIWNTRVPHRVQTFIWKCAKNAIPVRAILNQRMNVGDILCPRCHLEAETIIHALVTCPHVSRIWFLSRLNTHTDQFKDKSIGDGLRYWCDLNPLNANLDLSQEFPFIACLLWAIWNSRNTLIHKNHNEPVQTILAQASRMIPTVSNSRATNSRFRNANSDTHTSTTSPPTTGWIKINTDGAWNPISKEGGSGVVVRDSTRNFIFAAAIYDMFSSAEEAEIRAIWIAVKKAKEQNYRNVEIEGDAKAVLEQLRKGDFNGTWSTDAFLKDIKLWTPYFENIVFTFIPRTCNIVANDLAQWGKNNQTTMYWSSPPIWLLPALGGKDQS
ncbi:Ribonuclease H domain [Macleaya cordata]|uniref:Ribonuclease H domain n=1 Tax=Macleaya cordata TaxID=56857 RepID=A0A200QQL2_MACCD|nr:Ribonuclease H domain [Macleaya cordata]